MTQPMVVLCNGPRCRDYAFTASPACITARHHWAFPTIDVWRVRQDGETPDDVRQRVLRVESALDDLKVYAPYLLADPDRDWYGQESAPGA